MDRDERGEPFKVINSDQMFRNSKNLNQAKGGLIDVSKDFYLDSSLLKVRESKMPPQSNIERKSASQKRKSKMNQS